MLISLTDRAKPATGVIDTSVVDRALADTDATIDGYLAGRYQLPLASTPALVTELALPIAIYKMHRKVASEKIRKDYDDAMKALREISTGTIRLDIAGAEPASSSTGGVRTSDCDRPMTNNTMKGFI